MERCKPGDCTGSARKYTIKDGFVLRTVAGNAVIIPVDAAGVDINAMLLPNESAQTIWKLFEEPNTVASAAAACAEQYEGAYDEIYEDVEGFVKESLQRKVMEEVN